MSNPTKTRRQFTALQKQEAVELCLAEGLTGRAVAQLMGVPNSTLTKWLRQTRIDRGDIGATNLGQLSSDESAELNRLRNENRELKRQMDFQAGGSALCQGAAAGERFRLISKLRDLLPIAWLCNQLGVARSGFYAAQQRQHNPGPRAQQNAAITYQVATVFEQHRGYYGAPRIHRELQAAGLKV